jgi:hypothetical protein
MDGSPQVALQQPHYGTEMPGAGAVHPITSDGLAAYKAAVPLQFDERGHFAQLVKHYSETPDRGPARKYSPGICTGVKKTPVYGHDLLSEVESNSEDTEITAGYSTLTGEGAWL